MTNHTPGPLSRHPMTNATPRTCDAGDGSPAFVYAEVVIGSGDKIIAEVRMQSGADGGFPVVNNMPEMLANAALFIAAPDMLAALKDARENSGNPLWPGWAAVEDLIAKAEGREASGLVKSEVAE